MNGKEDLDLTQWQYIGDVDLSYGGTFYRFEHDYCEACVVSDLESACGADGLTLIECITIYGFDDKDKVGNALSCIGATPKDLRGLGRSAIMLQLASALQAYGYYDHSQGHNVFTFPGCFVVVNDSYGPLSDKRNWDSWEVDIDQTVKLHITFQGDLKRYLESEVLW